MLLSDGAIYTWTSSRPRPWPRNQRETQKSTHIVRLHYVTWAKVAIFIWAELDIRRRCSPILLSGLKWIKCHKRNYAPRERRSLSADRYGKSLVWTRPKLVNSISRSHLHGSHETFSNSSAGLRAFIDLIYSLALRRNSSRTAHDAIRLVNRTAHCNDGRQGANLPAEKHLQPLWTVKRRW